MKLSERGAIKSAIADGGFHLYPAGRLTEIIKSSLQGDALRGDFDPIATVAKLQGVAGPEDSSSREVFQKDMALLCERLSKMDAEYDIERIIDKMMEALPALAKRYYGLDAFEAPRPKIIEYFFEGINDMYKDADWSAFNMSTAESKEMNVPVGIYFKRDQVAPGLPEFVIMHEANHAMQEKASSPPFHHYVPWFDEGVADIVGRMMLFRATESEALIAKVKNSRTEVEVTDQWKKGYHFGEQTAALMLMRGRLPFLRALMKMRQRDPFALDWSAFASMIRAGLDPHVAVVKAYAGGKPDTFRKKFEKDEKDFRSQADLDQTDLRIIGMFLATTAPACLAAADYNTALWIVDEVGKRPSPYFVDSNAVPAALRTKVNGWAENSVVAAADIPKDAWEKPGEMAVKVLLRESDVPEAMRAPMDSLCAKYYVVKRQIGDTNYLEPYGGGLPYRLGSGEIRCTY
jgi:hypothetical protein